MLSHIIHPYTFDYSLYIGLSRVSSFSCDFTPRESGERARTRQQSDAYDCKRMMVSHVHRQPDAS